LSEFPNPLGGIATGSKVRSDVRYECLEIHTWVVRLSDESSVFYEIMSQDTGVPRAAACATRRPIT
jgi:hypothetical protein